ncbi:DUF4912 domain-containing protein [Nitrosococcus watsonii]|uniref:DUF4912 domain-containing protein n=1 Tax=Nitrosococcus watsoni (strain C-113) TaxID=105559 RepID=D8K869_NITWC|nr:DUF4912 domain-containing protein [Nitrosococcus watsonii]ADJ27064.1 conserved hypothetical protein [Nitrosococcus watsonii C-113]
MNEQKEPKYRVSVVNPSKEEKSPLSQQELLQISQETRDCFLPPASPDKTQLVLMVVNPYRVYAYWSILNQDLICAYKKFEIKKSAQWALRFYDFTAGKLTIASSFEVAIPRKAHHWYIDLWADDKCYIAELGLADCEDQFVVLARSNMIETPRAGSADPSAPVVFMGNDLQPSHPAKTFPLEFSVSPGERAVRSQELTASYFSFLAESSQIQPKKNRHSKPKPLSQWSASLPKRRY